MTTKDEETREAWEQLQPLRRAVLDEIVKPVQMTALGLDELVDRIVLAVAKYMGTVIPSTPQEYRAMADALEQVQEEEGAAKGAVRGMFPNNTAPCRDFANDHAGHGWDQGPVQYWCPGVERKPVPGCPGCGAQITETKHGRATLHVAGCRYVGERGPQA